MHTPTALVASLVMLGGVAACRTEEPIGPASTCAPAWRASLDLGDTWSDLGGASADDGAHVLVAWEARDRVNDARSVVMMQLLESNTGDVAADAAALLAPEEVWGIQVAATARGFLVFTFMGSAGVQVQRVSDDGAVTSSITLAVDGANPDDRVVSDEDGATLIGFALTVTRVNADGRLVSTTTLPPMADFCTGAAAIGGARLLAWCISFDAAGQWGAPTLISMGLDGRDPIAVALDDGFPAKLGRLAVSGERVLATFEDGARVFAAAFDLDGNVLVAPASIGQAESDERLLGEQGCTGTCEGLSIAASGDGAIVGFERMADSFDSLDNHVQFVRLEVSSDDDPRVLATPGREQVAHAHTAVETTSGPLVTWLDNSAFRLLPWDLPRQRLVVDRRCDLP